MVHDKTKEYQRKATKRLHWCKENKQNRKIWMSKYRAEVRSTLAQEDFENVLPFKPSGGWFTW